MIYVQVFKAPVYDSEGKCVGVQGIFWDVTDRQTAELRLRRTALELARSNEELQRFALVASQDLQDPLHGLQESTHSLVARCLHTLDQQAQQDLRHIQATADRMQRLLDDLLSLARVSTQGPVFETVDLNQVAREVVASLRSRIEESGGQVEIGDLPSIEADPDQVRQLLENLVDNALKFRRPETPPSVRIQGRICRQPSRDERSHEAESLCQIEVEDNGVGFDEQHLDRVFELFHRTSTENGTGLGLALCRKIAQRHGGTISARSIPGTGSTFIVTMAVKQARETAEMT
jgi:signal transduction histidine kinase